MHLVNFPKVRIKKYPKGYVAEVQKKKWWGKKYWVHISSVAGMDEHPWYFTDLETAVEVLTKEFKWDLIYYTNKEI